MEQSRKRVGETRKSNKRKTRTESPAPPRCAKKKTSRKRKADSEITYSLGDPGILDEKEEQGKVFYLCNWADDPVTGDSYPPSWVGDLCSDKNNH